MNQVFLNGAKLLKTAAMLILMVLIPVSALAQNQTIKGVVKDASTNDPLPGVNVVVKGTTTGTITDFDGNYTISAPSNGTLTFSFIGYELTEEAVNGRSTIDVALKSDSELIDEIVAVGYGVLNRDCIVY